MKKTILLGMTAASAVVLLASCSDDWGMKSNGSGSIAPLVGVDTQVITSKKSSDSQTATSSRAAGDAVTAADLSIRLTKSDGHGATPVKNLQTSTLRHNLPSATI